MKIILNLLIVGAGGFFGAIFRYSLAGWFQQFAGSFWFPSGTLSVNVIGCFLIGLLGGWADNLGLMQSGTRLFFLVGFLGSFTTFSTFGYETLAFLRDREILLALFNVGMHLIAGFIAVFIGYQLSWKA